VRLGKSRSEQWRDSASRTSLFHAVRDGSQCVALLSLFQLTSSISLALSFRNHRVWGMCESHTREPNHSGVHHRLIVITLDIPRLTPHAWVWAAERVPEATCWALSLFPFLSTSTAQAMSSRPVLKSPGRLGHAKGDACVINARWLYPFMHPYTASNESTVLLAGTMSPHLAY
jgi:hypothetical protein